MTHLSPGDPAPHFYQRSASSPRYAFDTAAGRYLVLCFFGSGGVEHTANIIKAVSARGDVFNDNLVSFFGVSIDSEDEKQGRLTERYPGYRYFWDFDLSVSKKYRVVAPDAAPNPAGVAIRRSWVIIDPNMRIRHVVPFEKDQSDISVALDLIAALPPVDRFAGPQLQAPVLFLPRVLEPEICERLVNLYRTHGGEESGFMRDVGGKTVGIIDPSHKRRSDYYIKDQPLIDVLQNRVKRRIVPEIAKVHQFNVTRMERYIVACYDAEVGGHFRPHRDNTTMGTAHRRFAVSINLNDDFDGGELNFPEYGGTLYKPPMGAAVVFSCSLLHTVTRVTRGQRFAFLPFLYDDAAAALREENSRHLADAAKAYKAHHKTDGE